MRRLATAAALLLAVSPAAHAAGACTLSNAYYLQQGTGWELIFSEVPRDGAANQTHAFRLRDTEGGVELTGAIYAPNGFSQALGIVDRADCTIPEDAASEERQACQLWDGPIYMNSEAGIDWIAERNTPAPRQVLLPGFGADWWYSELRNPGSVPLDVFTLKGCLSQ